VKKKRSIFVVLFIIIFLIYSYIGIRGDYLQNFGVGEEYVEIFKANQEQKIVVFVVSFLIMYIISYITGIFIKRGLKKFFVEEKTQIPKLANKSISLVFATVFGLIASAFLTEKAILAFNSAQFGITDKIFNMDIGYYIFQKPFVEQVLYYIIAIFTVLSAYVAVYYIIAFNRYFDKGIDIEILKKNTFIKQLIVNVAIIITSIAILTFVKVQDVLLDKFMNIGDGTSLYGAGLIDVVIKKWGYIIFSIFILICTFFAIRNFRKAKYRKAVFSLALIPMYLISLFAVTLIFDLIYVKSNELDKQKEYISYNIDATKNAYNINIDEIEIENSGTITTEDITNNQTVINNINILNEDVVLQNLEEYQTSLGYYTFDNTKVQLYNVNGQDTLVYVSPREIISNETRTYKNKTYEYTHGYGIIMNSASSTDEAGYLSYIKSGFLKSNDGINIVQPRIYFGLQTNEAIVTNIENQVEYDYPLTSTTNSYTTYTGKAGLKLGFLDRLILGIKEKNLKLAFTSNLTDESKIITKRNIRERAKTVMPYLIYDEEPYAVVTDEGHLVWVLDAYTTSDSYPYSQVIKIQTENGEEKEINYIRNSVKVLIDSYDGTMKFYITDKSDPIIMAYWNMYPSLFQSLDESIPEDISKHLVYPEYLYKIQAEVLERYHDIQPEVLYRADDVWDIAKENTTRVTTLTGSDISPYYTMVKTVDSDEAKLGLVVPYTIAGKQNINSYLIGTCTGSGSLELKLYKFKGDSAILGTMQLDTLIEQDETISKELSSIEVTGTKIQKNIIVVPINNTLLYVEPIYQVMLNESQVPVLKRVIVASGNKVAIGLNLKEALLNLLSQEAVSIRVESENIEDLIEEIIRANNNLKQSNESNDWEFIGRDMARLQDLIEQLEKLVEEQETEIE